MHANKLIVNLMEGDRLKKFKYFRLIKNFDKKCTINKKLNY